MGKEGEGALLFERKEARFQGVYKVFASTIFADTCSIWLYRLMNMPAASRSKEWAAWIVVFTAELGFGLYWIITQSLRWTIAYHYPFKQRLFDRYEKDKLPAVDIFVCTADPLLEPPSMVMNTVLSAMSFNYPSDKLSVYLSDDGGSELTFFALSKASDFSKQWIPFCRRFNIQPPSPEAYFSKFPKQCLSLKKIYQEMKGEIDLAVEMGKVPESIKKQHKGFSEWNPQTTKQDHHSIVQIIIDGRDRKSVDDDGFQLPTLVYMSREKRPNYPHQFKAGAMNALIRVSSEISCAPLILNLDCDMYPNDADTIQEALCFFMDEAKGHNIAYVQFPQKFDNVTKNDLYANSLHVIHEIELAGIAGAIYCGTGCFHRRESLSGMHFKDYKGKWEDIMQPKRLQDKRTVDELNEASKALISSTYENGSQWGKEMGLVYGIPVEDICTGFVITCRGWKSIYYSPKEREAFLGVAPTTLDASLVQHKRWSEGMFQIFLSKYCPFIYGNGKISLRMQMGYCAYLLWAPMSLPTLSYVIVAPICLLRGISLFPQLTSLWFIPFAYAFVAVNAYSLWEAISCGYTVKGWWNLQRMKLFRRTTSYLFGFIDTVTKHLGLTNSETKFAITDKTVTVTQDVHKRYQQEVIEFGSSDPLILTMIATFALIHLFCFIGGIMKINSNLTVQIMLNAMMIMVNIPVYEALFIRYDKGCLPSSIMLKSITLASLACCLSMFF